MGLAKKYSGHIPPVYYLEKIGKKNSKQWVDIIHSWMLETK